MRSKRKPNKAVAYKNIVSELKKFDYKDIPIRNSMLRFKTKYEEIRRANPKITSMDAFLAMISEMVVTEPGKLRDEIEGYGACNISWALDEKNRVFNFLTAELIEYWFMTDKNLTQNITSFSRKPFLTREESEKNVKYDEDKSLEDALRRKEEFILDTEELFYKDIRGWLFDAGGEPVKTTKGKMYSFVALQCMKLMCDGILGVDGLMYNKVKFMHNQTYKHEADGVEAELENFNNILSKCNQTTDKREFIANNIILRHFETINQIKIVAALSEYLIYNTLEPDVFENNKILKAFLDMYNKKLEDYIEPECKPKPDIISNHIQMIDRIFHSALVDNFTVQEWINTEWSLRIIEQKMTDAMILWLKTFELPQWTEEDFERAERFYSDTCFLNIIGIPGNKISNIGHDPLENKDKGKFYEYFHKLYDKNILEKSVRDSIEESKAKKRNKKIV